MSKTRLYQAIADGKQNNYSEAPSQNKSSYTQINIILFWSQCGHYCNHLAAILKDPINKTTFVIDYGRTSEIDHRDRLDRVIHLNEIVENSGCCIDVVTLYSPRRLHDFIHNYNENFKNHDYCVGNNNCADAVQHALNYFFPNECCSTTCCCNNCYTGFQLLCCAGFVGTLGLMNCFPAPPFCVATPKDVFNKAKLLSCIYSETKILNSNDQLNTHAIELTHLEIKASAELKASDKSEIYDSQNIKIQNKIPEDEKLDISTTRLIPDDEIIKDVPLNEAIRQDNYHLVKELLENKANPNHAMQQFQPNVAPAYMKPIKYGTKDLIQLLIEHKADINKESQHSIEVSKWKMARGTTPLMFAALTHRANYEIMSTLCDAKADVNAKSASGTTPLHWAAAGMEKSSIQFLINKRANPLTKNDSDENPVQFSKRLNNLSDEQEKSLEKLFQQNL